MEKFKLKNVKDFQLDHIFDCGQCFRWEKQEDGSYTGAAFGRIANVAFVEDGEMANSGTLIINNATEKDFQEIWRNYLDLDRDYGQIKKTLTENDPIMEKAVSYGSGIRILRQDLWETLISFIISQNNNIPRIKGCIEKLAENFGESLGEFGGCEFFALPSAEKLAKLTIEDLGIVKLGYRARYLIETARAVCENGLPENEEELSKFCGVGPKVANCIMLFGMGKYDSFPIDVWVRRVMSQLYGIDENAKKTMARYAETNFGELGGFAQQYLFYYIRNSEN